ncbi:hypothetical protein QE152_g13999 [Popillia japonica]|uniref:Uncharacterized protein n=1 Tax=Popillia japonica TaxID=7064 RepID=A0AAW1L886_POPJA
MRPRSESTVQKEIDSGLTTCIPCPEMCCLFLLERSNFQNMIPPLQSMVQQSNRINTSQLINIGRQIGVGGFKDLDDSDILRVPQADDTELTIEDLMELHSEDNQENQADDGIVVSKDLLWIKNLERLYSSLDSVQNLVDEIDANSQRRKAFKMGIQNTFILYKSILLKKRGKPRQPILNYFASPKLPGIKEWQDSTTGPSIS